MNGVVALDNWDLLTRTAPFGRTLSALASVAREMTKSERASITALSADGRSQQRLVIRGKRARWLPKQCMPLSAGLSGWAIQKGEPTYSNNLPSDPRVDPQWMDHLGVRSGAIVPMFVRGEVIGVIAVYNRRPLGCYDESDVAALARLAVHASSTIVDACLSDCRFRESLTETRVWRIVRNPLLGVGSLAVAEERTRIARYLHDTLAQSLGAIGFRLQLLDQMVSAEHCVDLESVRLEVSCLGTLVSEAYDDVRSAISDLTTEVRWHGDFNHQLAKCAERFAVASGHPVALDLCSERVKLPPVVGLRLLQIVEEALANVWKHAHASKVSVSMRLEHRCLELSVWDDGRGFQDEGGQARSRGFGLGMIRDRAREIGARLMISSQAGQGTKIGVNLRVP